MKPLKTEVRSSELTSRNRADYSAMTERIKAALHQIRSQANHKANPSMLAKLAGCSRATLYNRSNSEAEDGNFGWPLSELGKILEARSSDAAELKHAVEAALPEKSLEERLELSRDEVLRWKDKFDQASEQLADAMSLLRQLVAVTESSQPRPGHRADGALKSKVVALVARGQREN